MADPRPAIEQMAADLVEASERYARNNQKAEKPEPRQWLIVHHVNEVAS